MPESIITYKFYIGRVTSKILAIFVRFSAQVRGFCSYVTRCASIKSFLHKTRNFTKVKFNLEFCISDYQIILIIIKFLHFPFQVFFYWPLGLLIWVLIFFFRLSYYISDSLFFYITLARFKTILIYSWFENLEDILKHCCFLFNE